MSLKRGGGFAEGDREDAYALVRRTLVQLGYHRLGKPPAAAPSEHGA